MIFSYVFHLWGAIAYRMKYMEVIGLTTNKVVIRNLKNIILMKFDSVN